MPSSLEAVIVASVHAMGKLDHQLVLPHFSHTHSLQLTSFHQSPASCAACGLQVADLTYACQPCGYVLRVPCAQLPRRICHPGDPNHAHRLTLRSKGCFDCGQMDTAFFYHCGDCGLDLHCTCAALPLALAHAAHLHPLTLCFFHPYPNRAFSCDLCGLPGSGQWTYRCAMCEFDAHVGCATARATGIRQRSSSCRRTEFGSQAIM